MKKIMVLGASFLQTFMITAVKELGHYCIALDGNTSSEGFALCDKYYICSTTDMESVLKIAQAENIDAILTYASDVAAPTVAFVAERMNLPTNPLKSVQILTDKALTRVFMETNGFNVPLHAEVCSYEDAVEKAKTIGFPVILKPTDSSGSKGVSKVNSADEIKKAFEFALSFSRSKQVEIESFIERDGYQVDADCLVVDGEVVFFEPMDQHQDPIAPFSPIGISAPSVLNKEKAAFARNELQRLVSLLEMRFGDFNVEYIYDKQGVFYLLEVGPRGGGNLIPDVILNGTGLDLRKISVRLALGEKVKVPVVSGYCANVTSFIIHSQTDGKYSRLKISPEIEKAIVFIKLFVKPGDLVRRFSGGIHALGFCILKFDNHDEMLHFMDNTTSAFNVITTD